LLRAEARAGNGEREGGREKGASHG
jgi:hypothetical protein